MKAICEGSVTLGHAAVCSLAFICSLFPAGCPLSVSSIRHPTFVTALNDFVPHETQPIRLLQTPPPAAADQHDSVSPFKSFAQLSLITLGCYL